MHFDKEHEIENIVPQSIYFEALADYAKDFGEVVEDEYIQWETGQNFEATVLFSKRVSKWYKEKFSYGMEKAEVMDRAIEIVSLDKICFEKIDELIGAIRDVANNLHP